MVLEHSSPLVTSKEVLVIPSPVQTLQFATPTITATTKIPITITPSQTPEINSEPTLTTGESETIVKDLFQTNQGCEFPCWWGFRPGVTEWDQVQSVLRHLGGRSVSLIELMAV